MDIVSEWELWAALITGSIGAFFALLKLLKWLKVMILTWHRQWIALLEFPENTNKAIHRLDKKLDDIIQETKPNSGTSLKDSVNRIEAHMFKERVRQELSLEAQNIPVLETDPEGDLIYANKAYLKLTGRTLSEVTGKGWKGIIHVDDVDTVVREWESCVEDGRQFSMSFRMTPNKSVEHHIFAVARPILANHREPIGWVAVLEVLKTDLIKEGL